MAEIRRINLSFNLAREEDRKVYNILSKKRNKTFFVIKSILEKRSNNCNQTNPETLKQAFKEVLKEMDIVVSDCKEEDSYEFDIPQDVFDIIDKI